MASSKALKNQLLALRLYSFAGAVTFFVSGLALSFQSERLFSQRSFLAQCVLTHIPIIIFLSIMVMVRFLVREYLGSLQALSAKKLILLSHGILSICWLLLSSMQLSLKRLLPPAPGDPFLILLEILVRMIPRNYDNGKLVRSSDMSLLTAIWFLALSLIACALGVKNCCHEIVMERVNQEYETAREIELEVEPAKSTPLLPPKEPNQDTHENEKPEMSLAGKQGDRRGRSTDIDTLLASSRRKVVLGVFSLVIGPIQLWILFQPSSRSVSPITTLSWPLSLFSLGAMASNILTNGLIMETIMILIGSRLIPTN